MHQSVSGAQHLKLKIERHKGINGKALFYIFTFLQMQAKDKDLKHLN